MMRRAKLTIILIGITCTLFAQKIPLDPDRDCQSVCNFNVNTIESSLLCCTIKADLYNGSYVLKTRDGIVFKPGFQIGPDQLHGHTFTAKVDHSLVTQINNYEPSTVNGTVPALDNNNCIPGTIGGQVDVSASGAANYQIPIQVSPGSNGMQPNLSIAYSSQGGNGLLGWGWNIAGLSAISRVNKTAYYNNKYEQISLSSDDAFTLDGARLISGTAAGTYYPANNPYTIVVFNGISFIVTTQDGMVMEYGTPDENSLFYSKNGTTPISYAISRVIDPNGNYIRFVYAGNKSTGEYRISEILYTGNASNKPYNSIKFYYDNRTDTNKMFAAGGEVNQSVLLTAIKVFCEGALSKDYEFTYFNDLYSKLYKISLTADGVRYNPTVVNWGTNAGYAAVANDLPFGSFNNNQLYTGDFNGDGLVDIASWEQRKDKSVIRISMRIAQPEGGYVYKNTTINPPLGNNKIVVKDIMVLDRNSDGKDEVLVHFLYGTDTGIVIGSGGGDDISNGRDQVVRLSNTDSGITSQVECNNTGGVYKYCYGDFDNSGTIRRLTVKDGVAIGCEGLTVPSTMVDVDDIRVVDFDGDGQSDVLTIKKDGNGRIWEYNGTTFANKVGERFYGYSSCLNIGDFNGDGKTDFLTYDDIYKWGVSYSSGTDLVPGVNPLLSGYPSGYCTVCVDDVNNDGKSDICQIGYLGIDVYLSKGNGFDKVFSYSSSPVNSNKEVFLQAIDLNNDGGKVIVYGYDQYDLNGTALNPPFKGISFTSGPLSNNLYVSNIVDGLSNTSTFTYSNYYDRRLFSSSFVKPAFPIMLVRGPWKLVTNLTNKVGGVVTSNINFSYSDGYSHLGGIGFLGFKTVKSENTVSKVATTSNFEYTIPGVDGIYFTWLKSQSTSKGGVTSSVTNAMGAKKFVASTKSFLPIVTQSSSFDGTRNITTTRTITDFDESLGRVTASSTSVPGWTVSTSSVYEGVSGNISRPKSLTSTRSKGSDSFSSTTTLTYESSSSLRVVGKEAGGVKTSMNNFDGYGNPRNFSVIAGGSARSTSCQFDSKGRFVTSSTDLLGVTTTYQYRSSDGAKLLEQGPNGKITYSYSTQGGKLVSTAAFPDGRVSSKEIGWDGNGYYNKESITYGNTATTYFNALGQKVKETAIGYLGALLTTEYTYYPDGTLYTQKLPGVSILTTYTYKGDGRLSTVKGHNELSVSYSYGDNTVTTTSSVSGTETKTYDAMGNVIKVTGTNGQVDYNYYASGKVKTITAGGGVTSMTYDPLTLAQLTLTDPDAGTTTYEYNGFGELVMQKDSKQQITSCSYDAKGRLLSKTGIGVSESYTYFETPEKNGLLHTATRNGVTETYEYDNLRRPTSVTTSGDGKTFTTTMQYDNEKRLGVVNYPTGLSLKYMYDGVGNLQFIYRLNADNSTSLIWEGKPKNERNQWTNFALGNGLITEWDYDANSYMLKSIQTGTTSSPTSVQDLGFTFNTKRQLNDRWETDQYDHRFESFGYDTQNRLLDSYTPQGYGDNTTYNDNGNIKSTSLGGDYTYNVSGKPHAVSGVNVPAGTTLPSPPSSLLTSSTFTSDNRIESMDNGTYRNEFIYGPSGNRFKVDHKQSKVLISSKIYVGSCEFVLDNVGAITKKRTLIYAPTGICAVWEKEGSADGALYYIHTDYLGSWLAITNQNGVVENRYSYDAWGRPRDPGTWELKPISMASALVNLNAMQPRFDRGYTGHEHMAGFGLINMNGRLYDPYLQRFLSPDNFVQSPLNAQNYNRYTYCMNNPLMYTDPSGWLTEAAWANALSIFFSLSNFSEVNFTWSGSSGFGTINNNRCEFSGSGSPGDSFSVATVTTNYSTTSISFNLGRFRQDRHLGFWKAFKDSFISKTTIHYTSYSSFNLITNDHNPARRIYRITDAINENEPITNYEGDLSHGGGDNPGEIKQYEPNIFERFSTSKIGSSIPGRIIYGILDDLWVTGCSFTIGHNNAFHLNGAYTNGNETVNAGINTMTNFVPLGSFGSFLGVGEKTLNAGQFNSLFRGTGINAAKDGGAQILLYNNSVRQSLQINATWGIFGPASTVFGYYYSGN